MLYVEYDSDKKYHPVRNDNVYVKCKCCGKMVRLKNPALYISCDSGNADRCVECGRKISIDETAIDKATRHRIEQMMSLI